MQKTVQSIKKFLFSIIAVGIGILMVVAFTLPGSMAGAGQQVIGSVNGKPIESHRGSLYAEMYYRLSEYYKSQGVPLSEEMNQRIQEQAFHETVYATLMMKASKNYGIYVSPREILHGIKQQYFVKDGILDNASYMAFKQQASSRIKNNLENNTRYELHRFYLESILFNYIPISSLQKNVLIQDTSLERSFIIAKMSFLDLLQDQVSEDRLLAFYSNNQATLYQNEPFDVLRDRIKNDYIASRRGELLLEAQEAFSRDQLPLLEAATSAEAFVSAAQKAGMMVYTPAACNIYATYFYNQEGKEIPIEVTPSLIELIFTTPLKTISQPYLQETFMLSVYVSEQEMNPKISQTFRMNEVLLEHESMQRMAIRNSYQAYLKRQAEILSSLDSTN